MNLINTIDKQTFHLLQHQARRMQTALHKTTPPDRVLAEQIQKNVDDILDRRPKPIAVSSDGEVLWAGQSSPWIQAQATKAVNDTGKPERVLTAEQMLPIDDSGDDLGAGDGGVAVLDREKIRDAQPGDGRDHGKLTADEIERFGKELDL